MFEQRTLVSRVGEQISVAETEIPSGLGFGLDGGGDQPTRPRLAMMIGSMKCDDIPGVVVAADGDDKIYLRADRWVSRRQYYRTGAVADSPNADSRGRWHERV